MGCGLGHFYGLICTLSLVIRHFVICHLSSICHLSFVTYHWSLLVITHWEIVDLSSFYLLLSTFYFLLATCLVNARLLCDRLS